ncbi:hypothetical protein LC605_23830 [Nostoc sp. CHAB 5836]|uniref:hypothetical protein n=1 Tax=Nostoc sp. CHAB 5836 TaxID=2780404 RepID=UPI001E473B14|nr:hypothetical protein [Nostoc sp. CHAB 5836]MCC5618058.1 hypothetical protein [Nostoc sp. CHAB 5836]
MQHNLKNFPAIKDIPESTWENLSHKRILFGHQSVGFNIVEGMKDILKENPQMKMDIIENTKPWEVTKPSFIHFVIGENTIPQSKIYAFINTIQKNTGEMADIAFFKFCFVDITFNTDVYKLFDEYKNAMESLKKAFPKTTFVYVTEPLTSEPSGIKKFAKRAKYLLKQLIEGKANNLSDNIRRNQFNELLKKQYQGNTPIFDIAKIESTFPNGQRSVFFEDGNNYFSLVQDYTDDGGHLNKFGRKIVAEQLLIFLAKLSR